MNGLSEEILLGEAEHLHRTFFGGPVPPQVATRYVEANRLCFTDLDRRSEDMLARIAAGRLDIEAVELALRLSGRGSVLTRKIQILFYIAEVRSAYYPKFVNEQKGVWRALFALTGSILKSAYLWGKGWILIRRHRLA